MKCLNHYKWILIGDYKGNLNIFNYDTGEYITSMKKHENEVHIVRVD